MYTLEIDERSNTVNAILHDGIVCLFLLNGATVNEQNALNIVNTLNKSETNYKRKYVTEDGIAYYELYDKTVICNGIKIDKLFNDIIGSEFGKIDMGVLALGKFI